MMNVIDLFSGCGGFSRAFVEVGFDVVCAVENFKPVAETYLRNFPKVEILIKDIKEVSADDILKICGDVDVIIGSPPCEPFTSMNLRRMDNPKDRLYVDKRGVLTLHFIRIVRELRPKIFVLENVPQILEVKQYIQQEFYRAGFENIFFNILRAENYGNPSKRLRVFISNINIEDCVESRKVSVIEAIGDLPSPYQSNIPNHCYISLSKEKIRKISGLKWGESLYKFGRYRNWTRLHPHRVAPTVHGNSRFVHPYQNRLLTVREQARLMGFPDEHIFLGGKNIQFEMVGESVPIPLGKKVARAVAAAVENLGLR